MPVSPLLDDDKLCRRAGSIAVWRKCGGRV